METNEEIKQDNYSQTKKSTLDLLNEAKDYWEYAHFAGRLILDK